MMDFYLQAVSIWALAVPCTQSSARRPDALSNVSAPARRCELTGRFFLSLSTHSDVLIEHAGFGIP
jgi:hypothetical protein